MLRRNTFQKQKPSKHINKQMILIFIFIFDSIILIVECTFKYPNLNSQLLLTRKPYPLHDINLMTYH
jgi:hypothetical protein